MIRDGISRYRATGAALSLPLYLVSLATLERDSGNRREALALLGQAEAEGMAGDEHWMSGEIHRLMGEVMLALADRSDVTSVVTIVESLRDGAVYLQGARRWATAAASIHASSPEHTILAPEAYNVFGSKSGSLLRVDDQVPPRQALGELFAVGALFDIPA